MKWLLLLAFTSFYSSLWGVITFDTTTLDIPAQAGSERAVAVFTFTNSGDSDVTITNTKSSCGCTVPELDKKVYAPGEKGELKAVFTFGDRVGEQVKHITVVTDEVGDDGKNAEHRLTLKTNIPEALKLTPKVIFWRKGDATTPKEIKFELGDTFAQKGTIQVDKTAQLQAVIEREDQATQGTIVITPASTAESLRYKLPFNLIIGEEPNQKTYTEHVFILIR